MWSFNYYIVVIKGPILHTLSLTATDSETFTDHMTDLTHTHTVSAKGNAVEEV